MIELAYEHAEAAGLALWCQDEAGPYQAIPQPGEDWHLAGHPNTQPHEYVRGDTAKLLTLFRPATGEVRAKGVLSAPNAVLHPWLQEQLQAIQAQLDQHPLQGSAPLPEDHPPLVTWQHWWWSYERPRPAPALRLILIWDNLAGHLSYPMVCWLLQHGILPLYTHAMRNEMCIVLVVQHSPVSSSVYPIRSPGLDTLLAASSPQLAHKLNWYRRCCC